MHRTFILALALLLATTAHADAGPVAAAISAIGGILAKGGIGAAILKTVGAIALNVGVSMLQRALMKRRGPEEQRGVDLSIRMGDDLPVSFVVGKYATAGKRKYLGAWGTEDKTPNAYVTDVIELSSLPSHAGPYGLTSIWIDDTEVAVLWDEPHPDGRGFPVAQYRTPDGVDHLWIRYLDGGQAAADPFLVDRFGDHPERPFTSAMIGRGCQAVIVTARYHTELFRGGLPQCLFEPHPPRFYDLRRDSTNGGSGPHRWTNPATWEPTVNPIVIAYNITRGVYYGSEWLYGGQNIAAFRLPSSSWIAAANECDASVPVTGGSEPAWRCGYEIHGDMEPLSVLEELQKAACARIVEVGGIFKVLVGAPGAAVYSFTDDDIVVTEGQRFDPIAPLDETYNGIEATYPEPAERWGTKDAPARYDAALEAEDGNRRLPAGVQFPAVPFGVQVQRLMESMLRDYRRFRTHEITLPPDAYPLEPNDVVAWTSPRNGYSDKKFVVTGISGRRTLNRIVRLREIDPSDYDWGADLQLPSGIGWSGHIPYPTQYMTGWWAEPWTINDDAGRARLPAIRVHSGADQEGVTHVRVQVRIRDTGQMVFDSDALPYGPPYWWVVSQGVVGGVWHEARGIYVSEINPNQQWSEWLAVLPEEILIGWDDLGAEVLEALDRLREWIDGDTIDELIEQVNGLIAGAEQLGADLLAERQERLTAIAGLAGDLSTEQAERVAAVAAVADDLAAEQTQRVAGAIEAAGRIRSILDEIAATRDRATDADFAAYTAREDIRRSLTASVNQFAASFEERITTAASETAAVAQRATALEAGTQAQRAAIAQIERAYVEGDEALAQQIAYLTAGNLNQFDAAHDWYFDTGVEGWSGPGTPTASGGYLRPADGVDPHVVSPAGLVVAPTTYSQVRARIRRAGAPVWRGHLWWRGSGQAWNASRRVALDEAAFDGDGYALLTWTPEWSVTIDQIRLDLTETQSATDYIEIDWVAVGRPAPGVSSAQFAAERQARISGQSALASDVTVLQAAAQDAVLDISGLASGVASLESSVETIGGQVTAQGAALTALASEVDGKAAVEVVDALSAEVFTLGEGVTSTGGVVTAIRNSLLPIGEAAAEQDFANYLEFRRERTATVEASQTLETRIEETRDRIEIVSSAVTAVQAVIPGLATVAGLQSIVTRVIATEGAISAQSDAITAINAGLDGKADAQALFSLSGLVAEQSDELEAYGAALLGINAALDDKADASAVITLGNTVTEHSGLLAAQADAITSINVALDGKASVIALSTLEGIVIAQGNDVSAIQSALTSVNAVLDGKADSGAVQALSGTVSAQGSLLSSQAEAITGINTALAGKADASALTSLTNTVTEQGDTIAAHTTAITGINTVLDGKASLAGLNALSGTVTSQGQDISSILTALTSVNTALDGKASVGALNTLQGEVNAQGDQLAANTSAITGINAALPDKVDVAAFNGLTSTVTSQGDQISSQASAITSINNTLPGKANASAVNTLQTQVNNQGSQISAQATSITGLTARINETTADARMKMEVVPGVSGYARLGFQGRLDSSSGWRQAGLYIDVPWNASQPAQVVVDADRFAIVHGSSRIVPFIVDGGIVYIDQLRVNTHNIQTGAVSGAYSSALGQAGLQTQVVTDITGLTVPHGTNCAGVLVTSGFSFSINGAATNEAWYQIDVTVYNSLQGTVATLPVVYRWLGQFSHSFVYTPPSSATQTTFGFRCRLVNGGGVANPPILVNNRTISALVLKR